MADGSPARIPFDDVPELRRLVRFGLERDPSLVVVGQADDGPSGVAGIAELRPDVVFLDLSMPGMDGLEAIGHIRRTSPHTVIVVSANCDSSGLAVGAQVVRPPAR